MNVENLLALKNTKLEDGENYEFISPKGLKEDGITSKITIDKIYSTTTSKYGKQFILVCSEIERRVNCPKHLTQMLEEIMLCDNYHDILESKRLAFTIYTYSNDLGEFTGISFHVEQPKKSKK